jgi:hypothetical protein
LDPDLRYQQVLQAPHINSSVAIAQMNPTSASPRQIVVGAIRKLATNDEWMITSNTSCNKATGGCNWGAIRTLSTNRQGVRGGAITLYDIDGNTVPEILYGVYGGTGTGWWHATALHDCPNGDALADLLQHSR